ncbi:MAG: bifunctional 4-hydroxy-2-oxoglutarate aldolase/2-dehydro-3-deoxy-phosphogluconate aldolase [Granulosicoccaceae bacterium]
MNIKEIMSAASVIPVLEVNSIDHAIPLAEALIAGGLPVLEVTLRTPEALEVIKAMSTVPGAIVGVGTATTAVHLQQAQLCGAQFAVSPGLTPQLAASANELGLPLLPGIQTAGEIMQAAELGLTELKFFPAKAAGGIPMLKALGGPFKQTVFCPTGGISSETAGEYLSLSNVLCVGGSWVAPKELVTVKNWAAIEELASAASKL